jgi:hypothetical protein
MNVIEIRGIRGLIITGCAICCLAVGFIGFPGWILMHLWNYLASFAMDVPSIGIIQGILLWGIVIASYFAFRKDKLIVCVKSPRGLNEDELKSVFADLKESTKEDIILKTMLKAREAELKYKTEQEKESEEQEVEKL